MPPPATCPALAERVEFVMVRFELFQMPPPLTAEFPEMVELVTVRVL